LNTTRHIASALLALLLPALAAGAPPVPAAKGISNTGSLAFGRFVAAGGGAVTVGLNGGRTRSGSVVLLPSTATAASFTVSDNNNGNDQKVYVLTLPADGTVSLASGAKRMPVHGFTSNFRPGSPLPSGSQTVTVAATLQVAPSQAPGSYSGSFSVILEFE
jgi:hypothetical protein